MPGLEIRRRSSRLPLRVRVALEGVNFEHKPFNEYVETVEVGKYGAKILTAQRLRPGALVTLRREKTKDPQPFRVVHIGQQEPETRKYSVGLEMACVEEFWGRSFPPDAW